MPALVAGMTPCFSKATKSPLSLRSFPRKRESRMTGSPLSRGRADFEGAGRIIDAVAVLDHPDAEQRGLRRPAVLVVVRLLADFRPDANPESGARRVLHARRLFRLHAAAAQAAFLAGGDRRWARRRIARHRDGTVRPSPARRQRAGP